MRVAPQPVKTNRYETDDVAEDDKDEGDDALTAMASARVFLRFEGVPISSKSSGFDVNDAASDDDEDDDDDGNGIGDFCEPDVRSMSVGGDGCAAALAAGGRPRRFALCGAESAEDDTGFAGEGADNDADDADDDTDDDADDDDDNDVVDPAVDTDWTSAA